VKRLFLLTLLLSGLAHAQANSSDTMTARQYYDELRAAKGLNPLVTTVCFRPDSPYTFEVIGFTKDFPATAKAKGIKWPPKGTQVPETKEEFLFSQTYIRGVMTGESLLSHDKNQPNSWHEEYVNKGSTFQLVITMSPTGRYRRAVYTDKKPVAAFEKYGKCEPID
jgi:hypothetical protein